MPTFGDYESYGEAVSITDDGGRILTVWQAKKNGGANERLFAIKCFTVQARSSHPEPDSADAPLESDPRLEFIETVKLLKKARSEGGRCLAPIHDFGINDEGGWYATDYYKRTLKTWIALRGVVDDAALRHVVSSIVAGCRSVKKSCGRSHGAVKVGNIFLSGKPQTFRKTPLELIDLRPASLVHGFQPGSMGAPVANGEISQTTEIHDLHAIGLVILQLVEGRLVRNENDYNYPIQSSPYWNKLGKDADHWRDLCNKLLDPNLTLEDASLDSLAKDFRPSQGAGKLPLIIGGVVLACAVGAGIFFALPGKEKKYQAHLQAAQGALDSTNFTLARQEIDTALQYKPQDSAATDFKTKIDRTEDAECKAALDQGEQFLRNGNPQEAQRQAERLLALRANDPAGTDLLNRAKQAQTIAGDKAARQRLESDYQQAMNDGHATEQQKDWTGAKSAFDRAATAAQSLGDNARLKDAQSHREYSDSMALAEQLLADGKAVDAQREIEKVLAAHPKDPAAVDLQSRARQAKEIAGNKAARQQLENDYQSAMNAGRRAEQQRDWTTAKTSFVRAATDAQSLGDESKRADAGNESQYADAMRAGEQLLADGKPAEAQRQMQKLLSVRAHDAAGEDLLNRATQAIQTANDQAGRAKIERDYQAALSTARNALGAKNYDQAIQSAQAALNAKPGDPDATSLLSQAQNAKEGATQSARQESDYRQAMASARSALRTRNYDQAIQSAQAALRAKPDDTDANTLLTQAQNSKGAAEQAAKRENDYQQAMASARSALGANNYDSAIQSAQAALQAKPNDNDATTLLTQARNEKELAAQAAQRQAEYDHALADAKTALEKNNYDSAIQSAQAALKARPGDTEANNILAQAQSSKEAARREQGYQQALTAAKAAFSQKNYDDAIAQASAALNVKPGNPDAAGVLKQAQNAKDLQSAQACFDKGDYSQAQPICDSHKGDSVFDALAGQINAEQTALNNARNTSSDVSYSLIDNLKNQSYSQKPPFVTLIAQADAERKNLADLQALQKQNQWPDVKTRLTQLGADFLRKQPFVDLAAWADGQANAATKQLQDLDDQFQILLVHYNVLKSGKATFAGARSQSAYPQDGVPQETKDQDTKMAAYLQKQYGTGGWLDKTGDWDKKSRRQELINTLKKSIDSY
jgi:hypothetical protein